MNWLSTMKTRSNLAASACWTCSMYQPMFTLASPGISGSSHWKCWPGPPAPMVTAPSLIWRLVTRLVRRVPPLVTRLLIGAVLP